MDGLLVDTGSCVRSTYFSRMINSKTTAPKRELRKVLTNHPVELEDGNDVQGLPGRPLKASEACAKAVG